MTMATDMQSLVVEAVSARICSLGGMDDALRQKRQSLGGLEGRAGGDIVP